MPSSRCRAGRGYRWWRSIGVTGEVGLRQDGATDRSGTTSVRVGKHRTTRVQITCVVDSCLFRLPIGEGLLCALGEGFPSSLGKNIFRLGGKRAVAGVEPGGSRGSENLRVHCGKRPDAAPS